MRLQSINLSRAKDIHSLVEHRRVFNMNHCELNIFETYRQCSDVSLSYSGLVITSMMRGKKVMYLSEQPGFEFLPGETIILPEGVSMKVDFPEADDRHPVQCATLALDWDMVNQTLDFLNEHYPPKRDGLEWKLDFNRYHFQNNRELVGSINKLIAISMEEEVTKEALADLTLKSLLIRIIQTQNLSGVDDRLVTDSRFDEVIQYIRGHLSGKISIDTLCQKACMSKSTFFRSFKATFGLSPVDYIIREKLRLAKTLLADPSMSITAVCYQSGFNNLNYFSRLFKRAEGITPARYQRS
jgi:AraC family transcriptional regulator of arabinose operon